MKFREIATRLTGVSCPIFGLQWEPATSDVAVARGIIVFLEDRRVLYEPSQVEIPRWCVESAIEIRHQMTDLLVRGGVADELEGHLRAIRAACRQFVSTMGDPDDERALLIATDERAGQVVGLHDYQLNQALGELRATVGLHVAQIAVKYGIDIESPLETILPAPDA